MSEVTRCGGALAAPLSILLSRFGLSLRWVGLEDPIPGSYWGESEAGLVSDTLFVRPDTPVHSALHEACHYICMDRQRRALLHTDAGGEFEEENAVCYLQILLADYLPQMSRERMQQDMDSWGYTFRLGSAAHWFAQDAEDARAWLLHHQIIDNAGEPCWQVRHS